MFYTKSEKRLTIIIIMTFFVSATHKELLKTEHTFICFGSAECMALIIIKQIFGRKFSLENIWLPDLQKGNHYTKLINNIEQ